MSHLKATLELEGQPDLHCLSTEPVLVISRFRCHQRLHYPPHSQAALLLVRPDPPAPSLQPPVPGRPPPLPLWSATLHAPL